MHRKSIILILLLGLILTGCSKDAEQLTLENIEDQPVLEEERETKGSIFVCVWRSEMRRSV